RLKESKSYLVWAAVRCLGVSTLSDLVTEICLEEALSVIYQSTAKVPDGLQEAFHLQNQIKQSNGEQKRVSVHDRVRIPVAYDDLLEGENPGDE
ncbi:hypothetical protein ACH5RR_041306, partial [Cinchona calisaya]